MSDFDREAEREKLREQFGRDEDEEATARMSELLLKGATMTNKHCGNCSDPIFRHDGREFCPTCQHAEAEQQVQQAEQQAGETADDRETRTPADDEPPTPDAGANGTAEAAGTDETRAAATTPRDSSTTPDSAAEPAPVTGTSAAAGDLGAARASLVRTVTDLARRAEAAEDLGRKRDLLAATEEAAEALEAVRDAE